MRKVVCLFCLFAVCGCRTVETVHHEYHHSSDTLRERDSVFFEKETIVRETNSGDSLLLSRLGIQLSEGQRAILVLRKELERLTSEKQESVHDTIIKSDTIRVPYPVERKLSFWKRAKSGVKGFAVGVVVTGVMLWIRRRYKRF